ncbi:hypothetical protein T4B_13666 [Trichinella pseudospiralis]|uniref:Uncharacterized protein n=2 Tax=Trichinella pseudospiralis TaxID=6337 RepID=A0A0V1IHD4_TRIPS|nr:hypothetical protein T4D_10455 [Trichinella pseudospiralis]KRZ22169.1 hypothetical protein T4B_13666 [Trichinella pseudospiralis]KRZ39805.1 hypothetical protein T4C_5843 [Trichinella pseudospiralis]
MLRYALTRNAMALNGRVACKKILYLAAYFANQHLKEKFRCFFTELQNVLNNFSSKRYLK